MNNEIKEYIDRGLRKLGAVAGASKLARTDWIITRHRDQVELGIVTSITNEQYLELLTKRQDWRSNV